jgi:hypothetical protein
MITLQPATNNASITTKHGLPVDHGNPQIHRRTRPQFMLRITHPRSLRMH